MKKKQQILIASCIISTILGVFFLGIATLIKEIPYEQNLVQRWTSDNDFAHISLFLSNVTTFTPDNMSELEYKLMEQLQKDAIVAEDTGRLWMTTYSATGTASLVSKNSMMSVAAVGVGGDFFQFHPYKLKEGSYFNSADIMKDRIIIDEEIAWNLFGSNDVVGQYVWISEVPHIIVGVIEKETDYLSKKAGSEVPTVYLSYESLDNYGVNKGINCLEFLVVEQVSGYTANFLTETLTLVPEEYEMVQNNKRFNFFSLVKVLTEFPTRSMNEKAIIYPLWENIAKGYEDILANMMIFQVLCFLYPAIICSIIGIICWKNKRWHFKDIVQWINNKIYDVRAQRKVKKNEK